MKGISSAILIALFLGLFSTNTFAATTTYHDYTAWSFGVSGITVTVDFDLFTVDTPITSPLNLGPFTVHSQGGLCVDVPPYIYSDTVYGNGTPNLSVFVQGASQTATMSFTTPVYAWFGEFWNAGNSGSPLMATVVSGSANTEFSIAGSGSGTNSFGFISDAPVDALIFHNDLNDGFQLDNISVSTSPSVPIPGVIWLFGSGLAGIAALRRKSVS